MESSFKLEVGRLVCAQVRDILESEQTAGRKLRWHESSGLIVRVFMIAGDDEDVRAVRERLKRLEG